MHVTICNNVAKAIGFGTGGMLRYIAYGPFETHEEAERYCTDGLLMQGCQHKHTILKVEK